MVYMFGSATFVGISSDMSIKTAFLLVFVEMKQRFTGTQHANSFIIIFTTVVWDGLGTSLKLGARNVSIYSRKTSLIVTEQVKFKEKLFFNYSYMLLLDLTFPKKS